MEFVVWRLRSRFWGFRVSGLSLCQFCGSARDSRVLWDSLECYATEVVCSRSCLRIGEHGDLDFVSLD